MTDDDATQEAAAGADTEDEAAEPAEWRSELVAAVAAHDEDLAEEVAAVEAERDDLAATVEERDEEVDDLTERLQRAKADFQNYKKRAKKRQEEMEARATEDLVSRLLDVRDNLSRALDDESGDADALREGVELTLKEFDRVLGAEGVEEIAPEPGAPTDPSRHEVLMRVEGDQPEGTVAEVYRPGYEMGEKVLRAAQVTVSEGAADGEDGEGEGGPDEEE